MNSKNFQDLVKSSRTYRRFAEEEPLCYGDLAALVNAARFAPSANNMQALRFHIVVDPAERSVVFPRLRWAALYRDWDGPEVGERPTGYIAVCAPKALATNAMRLIDTGIAAQTIALAAASRGLGCCMMRSFDPDVNDVMGVSAEDYTAELILAVGVRGERVVLEASETEHGLAYWRDAEGTHHVPKLALEDLLI
ncbi:MAG: nitroreductase family protein [Olsenella sp.]|jgi:nitroreductase|nr:nitroreductase family protein [Olsenella sp.]MCI1793048.1 nitroreductase family protein [Olsenella sp.]MCI1812194.1 nitroreductase family protein [Olsenella sp.]MCI1878559.1 nitroreductase family protein [Olsenella sp.]MCI2123126.1 nitroreductase family protein [Olsenella sp.]